ncbi:cysteine desulfurase family protein [Aliivibrio fischeri]|uniref:cysteine desulfurase family protein n=1 Tax=Aliivibrio fischeri TaxID=668 RepID=UPI001F32C585|nr:cysteine desulfurase family protein [Aliivibrio fischeri]MCE7555408.1 cysteine desulfurase [Aliivibrio fischeri]MCE7562676.1 cysteine desulfurase [Aliivibrio fischeri]MCE7570084.1 cysteine desulfurase [Aliivibrio fischeri]
MNNYYDYAASTPVSEAVSSAMQPWQSESFANPSADHAAGVKASQAIQEAREIIADKIGAMPSEIIFTSGASEANNLAIKGVAFQFLNEKCHIITSSIEHKCVLNTCDFLEKLGFDVTYIQPNRDGLISPNEVKKAIQENTKLISIHHVNNELGTIQPISEFGEIAIEHGILFHTDAAQSFCKLNIDVDDMDIDFLSLSGHKIYGPKGIGALYVRDARDSELVPLIHGGGQELGLRGGTSPTPLIIGLAAAVQYFPENTADSVEVFQDKLFQYSCVRNGGNEVLPTILNITFSSLEDVKKFKVDNEWLISQGSACNAMSNVASHVLSNIGLSEEEARLTYRISLPPFRLIID